MVQIKNFLLYIKYYFELNDKYVRKLALAAAKKHFNVPVRNVNNKNPRITEYEYRRYEFLKYQRSWNDKYRHAYAINKIKSA